MNNNLKGMLMCFAQLYYQSICIFMFILKVSWRQNYYAIGSTKLLIMSREKYPV